MLGQEKLVAQLDDLIRNRTVPRFSIVVGERGAEHEDVAHYLAEQMSAEYIQLPDIRVDTIREMIKQAYRLHNTTVYCIPHADDMSINAKNALLKVIEEVPNKAFFVMCLEDLNNALATIQSRGVVFRMYRPKPDEIRDFARHLYVNEQDIDEKIIELYGEVCSTPGDVVYFTHHRIDNFYKYAEYLVENINKVSGAEVFKFSEKLALKDEDDKYDVRLFLKTLQVVYRRKCLCPLKDDCSVLCGCAMSRCIGNYLQDLRIKGINKTMLCDNLWLEMRSIWKSQQSNNR